MNERKDSQPLIERQIGEILNRKESAINRLAQFPPTLARYFRKPGTKERMFTHAAILAMVAGTIILTSG